MSDTPAPPPMPPQAPDSAGQDTASASQTGAPAAPAAETNTATSQSIWERLVSPEEPVRSQGRDTTSHLPEGGISSEDYRDSDGASDEPRKGQGKALGGRVTFVDYLKAMALARKARADADKARWSANQTRRNITENHHFGTPGNSPASNAQNSPQPGKAPKGDTRTVNQIPGQAPKPQKIPQQPVPKPVKAPPPPSPDHSKVHAPQQTKVAPAPQPVKPGKQGEDKAKRSDDKAKKTEDSVKRSEVQSKKTDDGSKRSDDKASRNSGSQKTSDVKDSSEKKPGGLFKSSKDPQATAPARDVKPAKADDASRKTDPKTGKPHPDGRDHPGPQLPKTLPHRAAGYRGGRRAGEIASKAKAYRDGVRQGLDKEKQTYEEEKARMDQALKPTPLPTRSTPDGVTVRDGDHLTDLTSGEVRQMATLQRSLGRKSRFLRRENDEANITVDMCDSLKKAVSKIVEDAAAMEIDEKTQGALAALQEGVDNLLTRAKRQRDAGQTASEAAQQTGKRIDDRYAGIHQAVVDSGRSAPAHMTHYADHEDGKTNV